ncbi:Disease resistance protein RPM1 [Hordeum vulgare]|nr:Disease resistance protein RPM1 [Hordeum vulgare]
MIVTLQDVSIITALPNEGKPLCMSTDYEGWRQQMEALIANFAHCPEDANDDLIQTYARMYMWYVIPRTIFADGTAKNAQWMCLKALTVFDNKCSWWSAALAYLYRWTKRVIGPQETAELVVVCSYFRYGAGNAFLLDTLERQRSSPGMTMAIMYGFPHGLTSGAWYRR